MPEHPTKVALRDELYKALEEELSVMERAHRATQQGATHEEAKPEDDKDTRAVEQSYLARGQARRVEELRAAVNAVRSMPVRALQEGSPCALGALVRVDEDGKALLLFMAPHGGGATLSGNVQVVTPLSPLGRALLGKHIGDTSELTLASRRRELEILGIE